MYRKYRMTKNELYDWVLQKLVKTDSGCLEWRGQHDKDGYGRIKYMKKDIRIHRFILEMKSGNLLDTNILTRHTCNNPPCCNPDHLLEGTSQDNVNDRVNSGRSNCSKGETQWRSKLKNEQVIEIYKLKGTCPSRILGEKFGVSRTCILKIQNGINWRHLTSLLDNK